MKRPPLYPSFLVAIIVSLVFLTVAHAEKTASEIKFSDPATPGTLRVSLARGDLRIHGTDAAVITVKSDAKAVSPAPRKDGLRVLTATTSFNLTEKNNVVTLDTSTDLWTGSPSDFEVTVPRNTALVISNSWGGNITVSDVTGDVEVKSTNGEIKLDGIAGGALVETLNGEITATVRELREGKPLSFTSANGEILIRVPQETKANVRLRSHNGSILTDFDEKVLVTKTESIGGRAKRAPRPPAVAKQTGETETAEEIHAAVHEAVKAGMEAAKAGLEVARAQIEAVRAAADQRRASLDSPDGPMGPIPPMPPLPTMTGGKLVTGTLNGGGPDIQAATNNGDVTLRKFEAKK